MQVFQTDEQIAKQYQSQVGANAGDHGGDEVEVADDEEDVRHCLSGDNGEHQN